MEKLCQRHPGDLDVMHVWEPVPIYSADGTVVATYAYRCRYCGEPGFAP